MKSGGGKMFLLLTARRSRRTSQKIIKRAMNCQFAIHFELRGREFSEKISHGKAGVVAQLVERLVRNEEVRGSTPLGSTSPPISFATINRASRAGFGNNNFRQQRQFRFQFAPNPNRDN